MNVQQAISISHDAPPPLPPRTKTNKDVTSLSPDVPPPLPPRRRSTKNVSFVVNYKMRYNLACS